MKITIQAGTSTYLIADKTVAVDGVGCYEGRLQNQPTLVRALSRVGSAPITLSLNIRNDDGFIPDSVDLWAASVAIVTDAGYEWHGKITAYDSDGAGILYASVTEKSAPELTIQIPDEVARVVTVDENFHQSAVNVTLPMAIGGNVDNPIALKGILIDKTQGIYLMSVGENRQFVSIRVGDTDIPAAEAAAAGYATYVGSPGQANYPGICYVQITDEALRKNDDGSYVQIGAQVVGLKLGTHTVEECRNGARFLYWLLKTSMTGSWGLGIAESDIDLDSFTEAISRVDAAGLKMDGVFYFRQPAQSWIDQICQAIRGTYEIGENGKRRLFVNADASSVKTYTKKNVKLLRKGKGSYVGRVFNKGRLDFDFNPLTGLFMQNVPYENSTSVGNIDEQLFEGQSYLIRDMATAQAILDYTCQKSQVGAAKVYFETTELPENPRTGQIITFDYPEKSLTGTWQITRLEIGKKVHKIEAEAFSSSIFTSGTPGTAIDWAYDPPVVSPVQPGQASGLSLETGVEFDSSGDGSAIPYISGTFSIPAGKYLGAAIFWGEGADPSTWNSYGSIKGTDFKISPVKAGQQYTVKVQLFNQSGVSAAITSSIVAGSHTELPPTPSISAGGGLGCIVVSIAMSAFRAFSHFEIQRQKSDGSGLDTIVSDYRGTSYTDDSTTILANYVDAYQYRVRAISNSGQPSAWSSFTSAVTAIQAQSKDLTGNQITGKDFRTAPDVGAAVDGVMFNAAGLQMWQSGVKKVDIPVSGDPTFAGTITATAGNIGGFTIDPVNGLYAGTGATRVQMKAGAGFWAGATAQNDAPFSVTQAGVLKATSGTVGGWLLASGHICKVSPNGNILNIRSDTFWGTGNPQMWIGSNVAPYSNLITIGMDLYNGGLLKDRTGMIIRGNAQNIFQVYSCPDGSNLCAQIAGWNFNSECLYSNNILINSAGSIQTCCFVAGNQGWKIDYVGNAEFNNICARGAIRTAVFIKDEISVVGGCTMIRPATTMDLTFGIVAPTTTLYADSFEQFAIGDLIRVKDGVNDYWGYISGKGCSGAYPTLDYIFVECKSGTVGWIPTKGQAIVNYGSCAGCGGIILNGQCPYIDLYTHSGTPWLGTESRVRIGNLNGWGTFSTDTYGIAAGCPTGQYMTYDSASGVLNIKGVINIMSGSSGITSFTDANLDNISDGSTFKRVTSTEKTGAGYGYGAISANGTVYAIKRADTRSLNCGPSWYCMGKTEEFKQALCVGISGGDTYGSVTTEKPWNDSSGGYAVQTYKDSKGVWERRALGGDASWGSWYKLTDGTGSLVSRVIPTQNASPSGAGLYLGSDYMGYYNAGWKTYMDNAGRFYLTGASGGLAWDGSTLTVCGTVCATSGRIACWIISGDSILADSSGVGAIYMKSGVPSIYAFGCGGSGSYAMHGRMFWGGSYQNAFGFSVTNSSALAGAIGYANLGTLTLPDSSTVACGCPFFWVGDSSSFAKFYGGAFTVKGTVCSCSGNIGGWIINSSQIIKTDLDGVSNRKIDILSTQGSIYYYHGNANSGAFLGQTYTTGWTGRRGLSVLSNSQNIFEATFDSAGSLCAQIAGWNFNATCIYSGALIMNSAGAIQGNYTAGCAGWCISCTGAAEFNNVTVRGTICASCGCIAGWLINANANIVGCSAAGRLTLSAAEPTILAYACGASGSWASHGQMYWSSFFRNAFGFSVTNGASGSLAAGMGYAGAGTVTLPDSSSVACGCPFFWVGDSSSFAKFYGGAFTVKGTICATLGQIGAVGIDSCGLYSHTYIPGVLREEVIVRKTALKIDLSNSSGLATVQFCVANFGTTDSTAPGCITVGSSSYYAMTTNGRFYASAFCVASDRNLKTDFQSVSVLDNLRQMSITKWRFKDSQDYQIGPMAQDFNQIFKLNHDWQTNKTVGGLDGIALRGIQELDECVSYNNRRILELEGRNACLETRLSCLESEILQLKAAA